MHVFYYSSERSLSIFLGILSFYLVFLILGVIIVVIVVSVNKKKRTATKSTASYSEEEQTKVIQTSTRLRQLLSLDQNINFDVVEHYKYTTQTVSRSKYLYDDLHYSEHINFLKTNAKKKCRNLYLYKNYYCKLVEEIKRDVHTPASDIKKTKIPYERYLWIENKLFEGHVRCITDEPITVYVSSNYYTPSRGLHREVSIEYNASQYEIEYINDTYSFSFKVEEKHERDIDYSSLSFTRGKKAYVLLNGVYYETKTQRVVAFNDNVKNATIESKIIVCDREYPFKIGNINIYSAYNKDKIESINFDQGFDTLIISPKCFKGCTNLKSITLPKCVNHLPPECFAGCRSLKIINTSNIKTISEGAFSGCVGLREIYVDKNCTIEAHAFAGCKDLLIISNGELNIPKDAGILCELVNKYEDICVYKTIPNKTSGTAKKTEKSKGKTKKSN